MRRITLSDNWTLENPRVGTLSAVVPGCVHTDLKRHGLLGDLYYRDNAESCRWIEDEEWDYTCVFCAEYHPSATLVFMGLDTYATVTLNGYTVGEAADMFHPHHFAVGKYLREGENTLRVHFRSPIREVAGRPDMPGAFTRERMHTRRIQCTYGWDWVDRFVTAGVWRPVYLEYADGIDVEDVYIATLSIDRYSAQIRAEIHFRDYECGSLARVTVRDPEGCEVGRSEFFADMQTFVRTFDIAAPRLWYPAGYGEQPIYTLCVEIAGHRFEQPFGIRTLKIVQLPDPEGSDYAARARRVRESEAGQSMTHNTDSAGFLVLVNGVEILCRGGNWVPSEPLPSEETPQRIEYLVSMAKKMGANFLRVWGGGIFEQDAFYTACDRYGILVAQDFLMACGRYPEKEEWFIDALRRESEYAVRALRNHPSLAWWHGDNENAMFGSDLMEDHDGRDSALRGAGPILRLHDPFRPFLPSSPYGGDFNGSLTKGTSHITNYIGDIFDYFANNDCQNYKEYLQSYLTRFSSEDGTFGAVCRSSMLKFLTREDLLCDPEEEMMIFHTKNNPARPRHYYYDVRDFVRKVLGNFRDAEDRYFKYKYIQYEWVRVVFENVRQNLGYSNGMVFWMFNDCWPAALGWSFVDYYGIPKDAYYAFRRLAAPVVGSVRAHGDKYTLTVSASECAAYSIGVRAYRLVKGQIVDTYTTSLEIRGYGTLDHTLPFTPEDGSLVVCDLTYGDRRDRCFYRSGALPIVSADDALTVQMEKGTVTLTANRYVHAVELEGEYLFEDSCFSLLAGESRTVRYERLPVSGSDEIRILAYTLTDQVGQ